MSASPTEGSVSGSLQPLKARKRFFATKANLTDAQRMPSPAPRAKNIKHEQGSGEAEAEDEVGGDGDGGRTGRCGMLSVSLLSGLGGGGSSRSFGGSKRPRLGRNVEQDDYADDDPLELSAPFQEDHKIALRMEPKLAQMLRPHQREGCIFIAQACLGLKALGPGCLLADDMGLGKTLQTIAIIYTFLYRGFTDHRGSSVAGSAAVICPTSLVLNWRDEVSKWCEGLRHKMRPTVVTSDMKKEDIGSMLKVYRDNRAAKLLLISYDTAKIFSELLQGTPIGLLVCDEAHKLKNPKTALFSALVGFQTKMRIMVTGTPIQNGLEEFYALLHFCIPGCLGTEREFSARYGKAIERARDLEASDKEVERGQQASKAFVGIVRQLMLRRTNEVIAKYLPAKLDVFVFCTLTDQQQSAYLSECEQGRAVWEQERASAGQAKTKTALKTLSILKKLINDPEAGRRAQEAEEAAAAATAAAGTDAAGPSGKQLKAKRPPIDTKRSLACSGKLQVMLQLLLEVRRTTSDRFVLISNLTTILDVFEAVLVAHQLPLIRLDGSLAADKRQERVDRFNQDPSVFAFLLSSKAGGCGINLIGANRLILFDPDWNPAIDAQALARVWRSGQQKPCYVYRFFAVGTLEEVCLGRQCSKAGLAGEIVDGDGDSRRFSSDELSSLFNPEFDSASNFHDRMSCQCCSKPDANGMLHHKPGSMQLAAADPCLFQAAMGGGRVSMAFTKVTDAGNKGFGVEPDAT